MKISNGIMHVGAILLVVGAGWAITTGGIGITEWMLLLSGVLLGILAGIVQGWAIALHRQGLIGPGRRTLGVAGTVVVLIALKVFLNSIIPSYLTDTGSGIWLSILFAVGGLLVGRALFARSEDSHRNRS